MFDNVMKSKTVSNYIQTKWEERLRQIATSGSLLKL